MGENNKLKSDFDKKLYQFFQDRGDIIPFTDEEIEITMKKAENIELPRELQHLSYILNNLNKKLDGTKYLSTQENYDSNYDTDVAMAARQGQEDIPNHIFQQMLSDRENEERKK